MCLSVESHSFRYTDIDGYWRQARGTGMRRALDELSADEAERLLGALARRVTPSGQEEFYSISTALLAMGRC